MEPALTGLRIEMRLPNLLKRNGEENEEGNGNLQPLISSFWDTLAGVGFSPAMTDWLWVADRCVQLNAQNIAAMPLRFQGSSPASREPAWLSNPDPVWYPNGITDAVHALVDDFYRLGDAFVYITGYYADGFPASWTGLDASTVTVKVDAGRKTYRVRETDLDPARVVQISRNPRTGRLRGTSALASYAKMVEATNTTIIAGTEAMANLPPAVLKAMRKLTKEQALAVQDQWIDRAQNRRPGAPPVLPPEIDLAGTNLGFSPADLQMIETQEFNARVLASAFGVPTFALNIPLTGGLTYQNPAMMRDHWWWTELRVSSQRFAEAFTAQMLPRGNAVVFDPTEWIHQGTPGTDQPLESQTVTASPSDQTNGVVAQLRPAQGVTA